MMHVEDFERTWRQLLREKRFEAANAYRRAWNRLVMARELGTKNLAPILRLKTTGEELTRRDHGRATGLRRYYRA